MWLCSCLAVVLVVLASEGSCAVWSRDQGRGQLTPKEMNIEEALQHLSPDQDFHERYSRAAEVAVNGIGYTQSLPGDRHQHGLVHWTGYPSEFLFILTRNRASGLVSESWLWRSTDYGHTFSNDTTKWNNDTVIQWYYIAPLSEYLIFADVRHQMLWVTRDEGETYSHSSLLFTPDDLVFQSRRAPGSNSTHLAEFVLGYDESDKELWVSSNLGVSWVRLGINVTRYSWRVLDSTMEDNTTVYFEKLLNDTHSELFHSIYPYTTINKFDESLPPFLKGTFVLSNEYMFVQMSGEVGSQTVYSSPLWVSRNRRLFRQARFPLRTQEKHYAVVDTSEGQVFIAVYHDLNSTHLYLSEEEGLNYTLSLNYIISPPEDEWIDGYPGFDVHVVEGIVGTYVANVKDPSSRFGASVISYDKGGEWVPLRPPQVDRNNVFINCQQPECSLHIHIQSSRANGYQSILTQDSAIGLIMAMGNLGSTLSNSYRDLRLYFSRDGGFTWFEVDRGYWQFQFAGQGAIVAAIRRFTLTSSVRWSCDEGHSWEEVSFLDANSTVERIYVIGMLTEFGEKALHVTVFGIASRFTEWLVTDLNFTSVLPNVCLQEDFFPWVPTDERPNGRCVLGESITYERRNSSSGDCCYPDPSYKRPINRISCPCAQEDFECDFGFERVHLNSPCTPIAGYDWPPPQPDLCPEGGTYNITSGYRLVAGDRCIRGEEDTFFERAVRCRVGIPQDFSLQANVSYIIPNQPILFTLIQRQGAKLFTNYTWNFGGSENVMGRGYEEGRYQVYTFPSPAVYHVTVSAVSFEGVPVIPPFPFTVHDPLSSAEIVPPIQIVGNQLPAMLQLIFAVRTTTQFNTNMTREGDLSYTWNFGDANTVVTPITATSLAHTYHHAGEYTVQCVVASPVHSVFASLEVSVYEVSTNIRIEGALIGNYYAVVGQELELSVHGENISGHIIPPDTIFSWHVSSLADEPCHAPYRMETSTPSYTLTLSCVGEFVVSVIGNLSYDSDRVIRANDKRIMAEEALTKLKFVRKLPSVVRNGAVLTVFFQFLSNGEVYEGPVTLSVLAATNHTQPTTDTSLYQLNVQLSRDDLSVPDKTITFLASNDVTNLTANVTVAIAVHGDYEELRFLFSTATFPAEHDSSWLDGLVDVLKSKLRSDYLSGFPEWTLDDEGSGFTSSPAPTPVTARQADTQQELFYADINLLPRSLDNQDKQEIHDVSSEIQLAAKQSQLSVTHQGSTFTVTAVEVRGTASIIVKSNNTLYIGLGVGLGAGLLLLILTAAILGGIIYMYRRRYKSLNVRYSRLRQTPVRFTFTQEGEMVEEDDYEEPEDEVRGEVDGEDVHMRSI